MTDQIGVSGALACPRCGTNVTPPASMLVPKIYLRAIKQCEVCGYEAEAMSFLTEAGVRELARSDPQQAARLAYSFADRAKTPETAEFWNEVGKSLGR